MNDLGDSVKEHTEALEDQTRRGGPTDDRPPLPDANLKDVADKQCMPCGCKMSGRNLIVCIDGTLNRFGEKNTNVLELYDLILKTNYNQRAIYNSGIGTYARPPWKSLSFYKKIVYHKIDSAIAWDIERSVLNAYLWLSDNYEKDDCIFLFGFSRGAYQVRVLSAMIERVGLVYRGDQTQIPFAYELYADPKIGGRPMRNFGSPYSQHPCTLAEGFKKTFSYSNVKVHFVGAWDTVSSIGFTREYMLPGTIDGMTHVCYFRHALALDERRVKFLPEYAYGGSTKPANSKDKTKEAMNVVDEPQVNKGSKGTLP